MGYSVFRVRHDPTDANGMEHYTWQVCTRLIKCKEQYHCSDGTCDSRPGSRPINEGGEGLNGDKGFCEREMVTEEWVDRGFWEIQSDILWRIRGRGSLGWVGSEEAMALN